MARHGTAQAAPGPRGEDSSFTWRGAALVASGIVLLAGVTVAAYYPALHGQFIWDDDFHVLNNATLRTPHGLWSIWTKPCSIPQWYPLVHTSFWAEYHVWKADPLPYHVDNVLLHILSALLFWLALRRLGLRGGAYAAALLFAVHPVMVESAGWITERKNVLSLVFYLGAALAYFKFDPFCGGTGSQPVGPETMPRVGNPRHQLSAPRTWAYYALAFLLFLCALLCKTVTLTLPVVLLLLIWWKNCRTKWAWTQLLTPLILAPGFAVLRLWGSTGSFLAMPNTASFTEIFTGWWATSAFPAWLLPWAAISQAAILAFFWFIRRSVPWGRAACLLPMLAVGGALGLVTAWLETHHVGAEGMAWDMTPTGHLLLAARIAWFYLGKLLWPAPIMFFYPRWQIDSSQAWQYLYPAAAAALVAALWLLRKRIGRGPLTAVLCFGATLLPALGFANVYPMRFSYVADHFQYHASLAIFALAAGVAAALVGRLAGAGPAAGRWRRRGVPLAAGACLLAAAGLLARGAWRQAHDYKDLKALWTNTVQKNPRCWIAMNNLALIHTYEANDNIYALNTMAIPLLDRALVVYAGGDPNRAPPEENRQIQAMISQAGGDANRIYIDALICLGVVSLKKRVWDDANLYFHEAMAAQPTNPILRNRLGKILCEFGLPQQSLPYFRDALELDPADASAHHNIASVYEILGLRDEAIASYEKAVAFGPDQTESHIALGRLLLPQDANRALSEFRRAVEIDPVQARALDGVAQALNALDRPVEALQVARKALEIDPNLPASLEIAAGVLSSCPDPNYRDGRGAVEYADRLCRNTNRSDAAALDLLAAAYAEAGLYDQAVAADQEAVNLALANRRPELADLYRQHQRQFRQNKPLRRAAGR